jgi:hypothetical protein
MPTCLSCAFLPAHWHAKDCAQAAINAPCGTGACEQFGDWARCKCDSSPAGPNWDVVLGDCAGELRNNHPVVAGASTVSHLQTYDDDTHY